MQPSSPQKEAILQAAIERRVKEIEKIPLPFGKKYRGQLLGDVPNDYLLYLFDTGKMGRLESEITFLVKIQGLR